MHATFEKHPEGYAVSPRSVLSLHGPNLTRRHSRTTAHQPHASPRARYPMDRASPSTPRPHRASTPRTTSTAHHRPRARTKRFIPDHITPTSTASRPRSIVRARPFVRSPIEAFVAIASRAFESLASLDAPSGALRGDAHGGDARRERGGSDDRGHLVGGRVGVCGRARAVEVAPREVCAYAYGVSFMGIAPPSSSASPGTASRARRSRTRARGRRNRSRSRDIGTRRWDAV